MLAPPSEATSFLSPFKGVEGQGRGGHKQRAKIMTLNLVKHRTFLHLFDHLHKVAALSFVRHSESNSGPAMGDSLSLAVCCVLH